MRMLLSNGLKIYGNKYALWARTMDGQGGNSLRCTAKNSLALPNFKYGWCIFCLPHRTNFSDIFELCLHRVSVFRENKKYSMAENWWSMAKYHLFTKGSAFRLLYFAVLILSLFWAYSELIFSLVWACFELILKTKKGFNGRKLAKHGKSLSVYKIAVHLGC